MTADTTTDQAEKGRVSTHQYIAGRGRDGARECRVCGAGKGHPCHYLEARTPQERDRELALELRRAFIYAAKAIEKRYDLTP